MQSSDPRHFPERSLQRLGYESGFDPGTMTPGKYKLVGELFHRVRALAKPDQDSALDLACNGDLELRDQVRALLDSDEDAGDQFLQRPAWQDAADLITLPESKDLQPDQVIGGRYRIRERIGAGGMGVVYKADDLRLPRSVALKIVPASVGPDSLERSLRFQQEARMSSQLSHPNIVAIYDTGAEAGMSFLAMEFVEGATLRALIGESNRPDARKVLDVVGQIASALSAAHNAGIIHRDVKPENVIVRSDGLVKVLDFGLACMRDPGSNEANPNLLTRPGQVAGTVRYLSPEQVLGKRVTAQTDVFSLGVVAYEYATGTRPFDGPTDGAVFDAILHREIEPPSTVRPELGSVLDTPIMGAIETDLDLRFQTIAELRSACKRAERLLDASAHKRWPAPARAAAKPISRIVQQWRSVAACLLTAVAVLVYTNRTSVTPQVTGITQITSGEPVDRFVNDGTRLYYSVGRSDANSRLFQISVNGGPAVEIPNLRGMLPFDISADHTQLLVGEAGKGRLHPLWLMEVVSWTPHRVGDLEAVSAHLSRSGDKLVYTTSNDVRVANIDGSGVRVLFTGGTRVVAPVFFDGDRRIRFQLAGENKDRLWDMDVDGSHLRPSLPDWKGPILQNPDVAPDGSYSLFVAAQYGEDKDLWAVRAGTSLLRYWTQPPVRLTSGPLSVSSPQFSPDGKRIFYIGESPNAELVRYDSSRAEWLPYLGGMNAAQLEFSRDGQWITYVAPPGRSIWKSRPDGRESIQLTTPPLIGMNPRLSPDNQQVVFWGSVPGQKPGMFLVSARGGPVTELRDTGQVSAYGAEEPTWSPDGRSVLYSINTSLRMMDVRTGKTRDLPHSQGLRFPRLSPDGRYAAAPDDRSQLWLYDMQTGSRVILTAMGAGYPAWARDSRFVYFENDTLSTWYRVNIFDKTVEPVANVGLVNMPAGTLGWVGLTADGSTISARTVSIRSIYAMTWTSAQQ